MKRSLKGFLAMLKNQRTSSVPSVNHCRRLKEGLETQPESTNSTFFVRGPPKTDYALWHRRRWHLGIKNLIPAARSLYEYI